MQKQEGISSCQGGAHDLGRRGRAIGGQGSPGLYHRENSFKLRQRGENASTLTFSQATRRFTEKTFLVWHFLAAKQPVLGLGRLRMPHCIRFSAASHGGGNVILSRHPALALNGACDEDISIMSWEGTIWMKSI